MEALLKVNDISMVFGGLRAVSNFSMEIKAGELIGLISARTEPEKLRLLI